MTSWVSRYSTFILVVILSFAFFTRVFRLEQPQGYVFDEVYHAVTAKLMARDDVRAFEWWNPAPEPNTAVDWLHPPLAKYTQAGFIKLFGETPFAWRISSAIFGLLVIAMTYSLTKELFDSEEMSLLAAALATFDGLLLVQSRVAMNDIHVTFFILLALTWYVKFRNTDETKWLWLSGVGAGLAAGSKWSGVFAIGIIGIAEIFHYLRLFLTKYRASSRRHQVLSTISFGFERAIVLLMIPAMIYLLSYTQMFLQGKSLFCFEQQEIKNTCYLYRATNDSEQTQVKYISHFEELHHQIWWYQTNLTATHTYQSRPWQWFLNLRPVWFHVDYSKENYIANIYAFGNPALFWFGALSVFVTILYLLQSWFDNNIRKTTLAFDPLAFLLLSYLMVWLPWEFSPRIMFFYHYTSAVPLMAILLAYWLTRLWGRYKPASKVSRIVRKSMTTDLVATPTVLNQLTPNRVVVVLVVLSIAICFGMWYPHWTGIPVSTDFANQLYFKYSGWK